MFPGLCRRRSALASFFALANILPVARAIADYPPQSFFFEWKVNELTFPAIPFPVPVTAQCDIINIIWSRGAATGPNPVPPYYLKVYTSLFLVPILIPAGSGLNYDWAVPFPPGTMYQVCMYDSNGNTGGCQDTYTVIPSTTVANCANATIPPQLDVEGIVDNGPISRYGWIEECTDLQVNPKNGTPPYILTIAPALHPPFNITGNGPSLNWTVDLSWGTPFFIGVSDSAGNMWSNGLLHSGGPGGKACLTNSTAKSSGSVTPGAAAGSGIGGLVLGLLIGLAAMFLFTRKKIKRLEESQHLVDLSGGDYHGSHRFSMFNTASQYYPVPSGSPMGSNPSSRRMDSQYLIEPFNMEDGRLQANSPSPASTTHLRPNRGSTADNTSSNPRSENKIYVVHHDNNAPPVTIYHEDGTEIVELPPRYPEGRSPPRQPPLSPPGSDRVTQHETQSDVTGTSTTVTSEAQGVPAFLQQQRRPDHVRKPPRPSQG